MSLPPIDQEQDTHQHTLSVLDPNGDLPEIVPYQTPSEPSGRKNTGCIWIIGGLTGCLLLPLIIFGLPIVLGLTSVNNVLGGIQKGIEGIINPAPPAAVAVSSQTVVQSVMPLGQLVSISVQMAKADISIGVHQGALNACGYSANHVAVGAVDAGVDLTGFTPDDVVYDAAAGKYTITLPAPEITSCRLESIRQYERTTTACNVDWDSTRIIAGNVALQSFRQDAIEGGILTRAQREAAVTLGTFIQGLTGKQVEIRFAAPPAAPKYPPSCSPDPPPGWVQDASGGWQKTG
jgi:hypothetical protein